MAKKTRKKTRTKRPLLVCTKATRSLVGRLKRSKLTNVEVAFECGFKSHNTVARWKKVGGLPAESIKTVTKLLRK